MDAPLGGKQEGKFMEYLADPFSAVQVGRFGGPLLRCFVLVTQWQAPPQ